MHEDPVDACFRSASGGSQDHFAASWGRHTDSPVHRIPIHEGDGNRRSHHAKAIPSEALQARRGCIPSDHQQDEGSGCLLSRHRLDNGHNLHTNEGGLGLSVNHYRPLPRKVIAMRMSHSMSSMLCCGTLEDALHERGFPSGVIIHSDKGSQYRSRAFAGLAARHSVLQSFTSPGHSCDENAAQESFHATLKRECIHGIVFEDLEHAQRVIFR